MLPYDIDPTPAIICDALLQNREQATFWAKWVFGIIVSHILPALIWYQNQVHTSTFWDMIICVQDCQQFLWKCDFEKSAFKVSYSYSFGFDRLQKMQTFFFFFLWATVQKWFRNYMKVIENIKRYVRKQNLKIDRWVTFHPYANFGCPYLKNRPVRLVPCFVGVHHIIRFRFRFNFVQPWRGSLQLQVIFPYSCGYTNKNIKPPLQR